MIEHTEGTGVESSPSVTAPEIDYNRIAETVAQAIQPQPQAEPEPEYYEYDYDAKINRIAEQAKAAEERAKAAEKRASAFYAIPAAAQTVLAEVPQQYRAKAEQKVQQLVAELAQTNPDLATQLDSPTAAGIRAHMANMALGAVIRAGNYEPEPGAQPGASASIPNYRDIVEGFEGAYGRKPTDEEIKAYAEGWNS